MSDSSSWIPLLIAMTVEVGALGGAIFAIRRLVVGVRSDIAQRVAESVTLRRDVDETRAEVRSMGKRSRSEHAAIRELLDEAAQARKSLHVEVASLDRALVDLRGDVRVVRARLDAAGVNGGGRRSR